MVAVSRGVLTNGSARLLASLFLGTYFAGFCVVGAQAQILDDAANVKILSAQARTLLINEQFFDDQLKGYGLPSGSDVVRDEYLNNSQCGSVSIGNNFASNQIGTDITVIIVGDIINAGNSCGGG